MIRVCLLSPDLKHNLFLKILHRKTMPGTSQFLTSKFMSYKQSLTHPYTLQFDLLRSRIPSGLTGGCPGKSSSKPQLNYPHQHQWKHNTLVPTITSAGISGHMNATCSFAPMDIAVSVRFIKYKVYRLLDVGLIFRSVRFIF